MEKIMASIKNFIGKLMPAKAQDANKCPCCGKEVCICGDKDSSGVCACCGKEPCQCHKN